MKHVLLALGVSALSLCTLSFGAYAADKPVVKIGATLPLTGDSAHLGESARDAMILAKESLPKNTKYDYELVFEDDGLEAKKTAAAANKLINIDKVDSIMSFSSGTGGVVSPMAERSKLIHFGLASAQSVADGDYNFIHWTPPAVEGTRFIEELKKQNYKKIAILCMNQQGVLAMRDQLKAQVPAAGIEIVNDQIADPSEKDFRTMIAKAKATNPDAYVLLFFSPQLEILGKQVKEAGVTQPLTAIESFGLAADPSLFEGSWYVDAADAGKGFNETFEKRFKKQPQLGAPNAYDVVTMIEAAYESAPAKAGEKPAKEDVIKALHALQMDGMLGHITIDEKGVVSSPASLKIVKDGKPAPYEAAAKKAE